MRVRAVPALLGLAVLAALAAALAVSGSADDDRAAASRDGRALGPSLLDASADPVGSAVLRYHEHYWTCLRAPAACDPARATVAGSAAFDDLATLARTFADNRLFVGPEDPGSIEIESVEIGDQRAVVTACWWTTAVLYQRSPVEGEPPVAQTASPRSGRETYEVVAQGGPEAWSVRRADRIGELTENVNQCRAGR